MGESASKVIDIIIPVFNEGEVIISTLRSLAKGVRRPFRVLICYDFDEDTTLDAIRAEGSHGVFPSAVRPLCWSFRLMTITTLVCSTLCSTWQIQVQILFVLAAL